MQILIQSRPDYIEKRKTLWKVIRAMKGFFSRQEVRFISQDFWSERFWNELQLLGYISKKGNKKGAVFMVEKHQGILPLVDVNLRVIKTEKGYYDYESGERIELSSESQAQLKRKTPRKKLRMQIYKELKGKYFVKKSEFVKQTEVIDEIFWRELERIGYLEGSGKTRNKIFYVVKDEGFPEVYEMKGIWDPNREKLYDKKGNIIHYKEDEDVIEKTNSCNSHSQERAIPYR